ncbi:MetQ/NlpA family ABC transporter substrate-binding protein [Bacillaceae bacterium Marseille-Q3522]|nr:MetQ/NlpA family ABC transporter substrate-binding protein [Bacillaceae bacterium Marseille-Q3522]
MKKGFTLFISILFVLALAACGTGSENAGEGNENGDEPVTLTVGASPTPHAEILEQAKPLLAEKGIDLQIETFQDYVLPNEALQSEDIDANFFQHIPYLNGQIEEHGYDFANAGGIHVEPMGVYSKEYKSLNELPEGATVIFSNSVAEHGRILSLLEKGGLIKLADDIDKTKATLKDIVENPKNIDFKADYEPALLTQIFNNNEGDAVVINSNYAIDAGLNPVEDSIEIEDSATEYVNIITVRAGDENREEIKTLVEVLRSKEIQDFILNEYGGAVVPVTD